MKGREDYSLQRMIDLDGVILRTVQCGHFCLLVSYQMALWKKLLKWTFAGTWYSLMRVMKFSGTRISIWTKVLWPLPFPTLFHSHIHTVRKHKCKLIASITLRYPILLKEAIEIQML